MASLRRTEIALAVGLFIALAAAGLVGRRAAPDEAWEDHRASTYLTGPHGAKGLAEILRRLGVQVRQRRRPLFDLADERGRVAQVVAFLDIAYPTAPEIQSVRDFVAGGGRVFIAGSTRIEACFGFDTRRVAGPRWTTPEESLSVVAPDADSLGLPATTRVLVRLPPDSLYPEVETEEERCPPLYATATDTLLATGDGRPVALALRFGGGGRATLVADVVYVSNRVLKETNAALLVVPWFLDGGEGGATQRVMVDEYHHGFGEGSGLFGAALRWVVAAPAGWAVLQLVGVALVALAVAAVRFGPAQSVIERRRRSPLEHLEALAAGLEGAAGADIAVELTVAGLRRRLSRTGRAPARDWLASLARSVATSRGRAAVRRLQSVLTQRGGDERVLAAAHAVEDVWEELRPRATRS